MLVFIEVADKINIMKTRNQRASSRKRLIIALIIIVILFVLAGLAYYLYQKKHQTKISPAPTPTITQLPKQPASNNGEKKPTTPNTVNDGTATDNNGQISEPISSSPSQWTSSASGLVTVKKPIAGEVVTNGFELAGTAKVSKLQYRLLDNEVGVISRGFINVVSGNFSVNVSFSPHSKAGRLDVFTTDDNGVESNEVQINVRF